MITAKEAKYTADNSNNNTVDVELADIMEAIRKASVAGDYKLNYYKTISHLAAQKLKEAGYKLEAFGYNRDNLACIIKWS